MKQLEGKVLFLDKGDVKIDDIADRDIATIGVIIVRGAILADSAGIVPSWVAENRVRAFVAAGIAKDFRVTVDAAGLFAVELSKKDMDDIFKTFAAMERPSCRVTHNDDGTGKVKIIAGSLSKSYVFDWE